jgi:aspartate aminotransferase-like enzyme
MSRTLKLLTPGPVAVAARLQQEPVLFHRSEHFREIIREATGSLRRLLPAGHLRHCLVPMSGTMALDAVVWSLTTSHDHIAVIADGHFGYRLGAIAQRAGRRVSLISSDWAEGVKPDQLDQELKRMNATFLAVSVLETSTSYLHPLKEFAGVCRQHGVRMIVDAVSAMFAEDLDLSDNTIAACVAVSNKALEARPGIGFVLCDPDSLARGPIPFSLDLHTYLAYAEGGEMPFTPPVTIVAEVCRALATLEVEGITKRRSRFRALLEVLRGAMAEPDHNFVKDAMRRSAAIMTMCIDAARAATATAALRDAGYVAQARYYTDPGAPDGTFLQVSLMGDLTAEDALRAGQTLAVALR